MVMRILVSMATALAAISVALAGTADVNGDGLVSKEEFRNEVARTAFAADKNKNGKIDEGEMQLSAEARQKRARSSIAMATARFRLKSFRPAR